jgi:hypothetical protein
MVNTTEQIGLSRTPWPSLPPGRLSGIAAQIRFTNHVHLPDSLCGELTGGDELSHTVGRDSELLCSLPCTQKPGPAAPPGRIFAHCRPTVA